MDGATEVGYKPPPEFEVVKKEPLVEINLTDSTELWLVQWPINQAPDFDGQQVSLKLHHDGQLGSFEGSSGKSYEVVSFKSQDPQATVFLSSTSESKIVGKISRRVSFVHYPEPSELQTRSSLNLKQMAERAATSLTNSGHHFGTPTQGIRSRSSRAVSGYTSSIRSSRSKSSMSGAGEPSKPPKRRNVNEPTRSTDQSIEDSGKGHSGVTSTSSLEDSRKMKSKKKKKNED